MTKSKMNKEKIKELMNQPEPQEEVKHNEQEQMPEPEVQDQEQKQMVLRKSAILELVNQAKATMRPGITASIVESIESDATFWDRVNRLPFASLFSGRVKAVWGQAKENEAPEIVFVSQDLISLLNAIMEDVASLTVFHQTAKMRLTNRPEVMPDYMGLVNTLIQLNVLISVVMDELIQRQRQAQQE